MGYFAMKFVNVEQMAENIRKNEYGQWGKGRTSNEPGTEPGHASFRLGEPALALGLRPKEMLPPAPKVFTMGSCFAREIEVGLARRGIDVLSMPPEILEDPDFQDETGYVRRGIINRYNTPSMELEFRNLLGDESVISDSDMIVQTKEDAFYDAHYVGDYPAPSVDDLLRRRRKLRQGFRGLRDAEVIVITLGLAEACFDVRAGKYRNMSPTIREIRQRKPLEIHLTDFRTNMQCLENIYRLIRTYCTQNPLIVCTVSPVPLTMTYFNEDVIVANSAAKAILRAAAHEFSTSFDRVDYFPSYEYATLSTRRLVYTGDQRHIRKPFVDYIIGNFMSAYGLATVDEVLAVVNAERA
jgi:hypothetical protein